MLETGSTRADLDLLRLTFAEARASRERGETPIGAIITLEGQIIARSGGRELELADPTAHAKLLAIREACRRLNTLNLAGATLYASVEPCVMCSGAIKWAGIQRVVFSVRQSVLQAFSGGRIKPTCAELVNTGQRRVEVIGPALESEGQELLRGFQFGRKAQAFQPRPD